MFILFFFLIVLLKVNPSYVLLFDLAISKEKPFNYLSSSELSVLCKVFSGALLY